MTNVGTNCPPRFVVVVCALKKARLVHRAKASELGVRVIWPVNTDFAGQSGQYDRLAANAIEAAEQTERLDIADIQPFVGMGWR